MPLNTESPPNDSRQEFCLALKAARERRGITLHEIAVTTKIPASLFAALERSDLRHWPKGLYRRSFFRDYARTIGLPTAEVCEEFVRLFPDDEGLGSTKEPGAVDAANGAPELRLVLDASWRGPRNSALFRFLAAMREWITDARRIGPPPRLRVRIKVSH
jgi:hypothetical protein